MVSLDVFIPAGGVELCVQEGRPQGNCGRCCPAKPSFDHTQPDSLPLVQDEWRQFQATVQNAIAGMKSEKGLLYFLAVPGCLIAIMLVLAVSSVFRAPDSNCGPMQGRRLSAEDCGSMHGRRLSAEGEVSSDFENLGGLGYLAAAIALCAASMAVSIWASNCNEQQDKLIEAACSELATASSGRLTATYHTFFTGPCRVRGRQPHRVIVIAPSPSSALLLLRPCLSPFLEFESCSPGLV
jgi:hypothetical protein